MIRVTHSGESGAPSYIISREGSSAGRDGRIGGVFAHEAAELVKEIWNFLSRLEREEVLDRVVPRDYCNNGDHPEP